MSWFTVVPRLLRDPQAFYQSMRRDQVLGASASDFVISAVACLCIYGFTTGLAHSWRQAVSSAFKLPLLFLITTAFCLPALYFFALALLGSRLSILQVTTVVLSGVGITAFLLLGLSPITLFFDLTSTDYAFFRVLIFLFVGISGAVGFFYMLRGLSWVDEGRTLTQGGLGRVLLSGWILLYGFVAAQMTWRLSPFIGDPSEGFLLFRPSRDNFFVDVMRAFQESLGMPQSALGNIERSTICYGWLLLLALGAGILIGAARQPASRPSATGGGDSPPAAESVQPHDVSPR